jgi:enoyl-CoA hydratase/carnithine racemase
MTRLVGPARAKELIFSAKLVDAVEASRIGFVDIVAQEGDGIAAFNKGVQLARSFAKNGKFKRRIDESREARNSGTNMVVLSTSSGFQRNIGGMVHRIRLRRMISCSVPRAELARRCLASDLAKGTCFGCGINRCSSAAC